MDSAKEAVAVRTDATLQRAGSAAGSMKNRFDDLDLEALLSRLPVPASPVTEDWRFSLSKIITSGEKPRRAPDCSCGNWTASAPSTSDPRRPVSTTRRPSGTRSS
ncbi:hypothetical protein GCM10029992_08630 [Glycomyces albus]